MVHIRNFRDCHGLALAATADEKDGTGNEGETTAGERGVDFWRTGWVARGNAAGLCMGPNTSDQEKGGDREEST